MLFVVRTASLNRSFTRLMSLVIPISQVLGLSLVFLGLAAGFSSIRFGSIRAGQAWFAGDQLFVENPRVEEVIDFSEYEAALKFEIFNLGKRSVAILGFSNSCSCTVVDELPDSIHAGGHMLIQAKVKIDPTKTEEPVTGTIRLFTDHPNYPEINLSYHLRPVGPSAVLSSQDSRVE